MKSLSNLVGSVPASVTAAMMQKGRELAAAGKDVINLAGGEPDFDTPKHIQEAAFEAIRKGDTHYPPSFGTPALLEAIVNKLARENGVSATPDQILVTPGAKWAIFAGLAATLNPGDEVLILDPAWVSYAPMVQLNGGVPVHVGLPAAENFHVSEAILRRHVTEKTKLIMACSPNNPTGRVLQQDEIDAIVKIAVEFDLYVMSDEIYEHILFDGQVHHSLAAQPGMAERTLIINGFSKAYAMTGWRLGWLAAPAPIAKLARDFQTQSVTSATSFVMAAGVAALNGPQECVHEMTAAYAAPAHLHAGRPQRDPRHRLPRAGGGLLPLRQVHPHGEGQPASGPGPAGRRPDRHHPRCGLWRRRRGPHPLQHRHLHDGSGKDRGAYGEVGADTVR